MLVFFASIIPFKMDSLFVKTLNQNQNQFLKKGFTIKSPRFMKKFPGKWCHGHVVKIPDIITFWIALVTFIKHYALSKRFCYNRSHPFLKCSMYILNRS